MGIFKNSAKTTSAPKPSESFDKAIRREAEERNERTMEEAALAVSNHVADSFIDDDGAGYYVYKALNTNKGFDENHLIAFIPLDESPNARWTVSVNFGINVIVSDFTISTPATEVAQWLNAVIEQVNTEQI